MRLSKESKKSQLHRAKLHVTYPNTTQICTVPLYKSFAFPWETLCSLTKNTQVLQADAKFLVGTEKHWNIFHLIFFFFITMCLLRTIQPSTSATKDMSKCCLTICHSNSLAETKCFKNNVRAEIFVSILFLWNYSVTVATKPWSLILHFQWGNITRYMRVLNCSSYDS